MKYSSCLFLIVFFNSMSLFSQEKYKQHTVSKGETISEIAQKYNVKTSTIYELNPDAVNGIKWKTVLLIPTNTNKNTKVSYPAIASKNPENKHEVLPKETLYGIAKQHNITIEDLYKINPNLQKEGLKTGQSINIPQNALENFAVVKTTEKPFEVKKASDSKKDTPKQEVVSSPKAEQKIEIPTEGIEYEVLPKESLYSIAKKYGVKLADLQKANPILENSSLKVGQKIIVPVKSDAISNPVVEKKEVAVLPKVVAEEKKPEAESTHEVLPKESLYSIAKQYGITLSDLKKANPELGNKSLKVGQKINVPANVIANPILVADTKVKTEKEVASQIEFEDKKPEIEMAHEVLPKETKYGIAKQYGLTVTELEKQNPNISKKLLVGSMLKIRTSKVMEVKTPNQELAVVKEEPVKATTLDGNNKMYDVEIVDKLISTASENIGIRYRSGGTTKDGFDCSGFMCYTFGTYDIKLPRSSIEMAAYGSKIDTENAQKGDLIFFKTRGGRRINHVGMVVEVLDGEIKFIHSSTSSGIMISSTKESYYEKNFAQVNRVLQTQM